MWEPISESQNEAVRKYRASKLDRMEIYVPKGQKQLIKAHAKKHQPSVGEPGKEGYSPSGSVTAFVNRAIREAIERDELAAEPKPEITHERVMEEAAKIGLVKPKHKRG